MANIRIFTKKAALDRNRARKYRLKLKLLKNYENLVRDEMNRRRIEENKQFDGANDIFTEQNENTRFDYDEMCDFKESLQCWTVKHRITRIALNDLLSILITAGFNFLPKDSRTLMKTPVTVPIKNLRKGQLWYHGIKVYIEQLFQQISSDLTITLDFNFDGQDPFNSSRTCFWPIIASIRGKFIGKQINHSFNFIYMF